MARGRVWTGTDAVDAGLVDRIGGLRDAVQVARAQAGLPDNARVYPADPPRPTRAVPSPEELLGPAGECQRHHAETGGRHNRTRVAGRRGPADAGVAASLTRSRRFLSINAVRGGLGTSESICSMSCWGGAALVGGTGTSSRALCAVRIVGGPSIDVKTPFRAGHVACGRRSPPRSAGPPGVGGAAPRRSCGLHLRALCWPAAASGPVSVTS